MNVLVLAPAPYDTSPGQRFRIEQWAPHLEATGIELTYAPFGNERLQRLLYQRGHRAQKAVRLLHSFWRRAQTMRDLKKYDLVFIHREAALAGPPIFESWVARSGVPFVFDFDDAIWVRYVSPTNRYFSYLKFFGKAATICRMSAHVLVGNAYLADYARQHNDRVTIVPTTVDLDRHTVRKSPPKSEKLVTIGWTGSHSTIQHLDTLRSALTRLRRSRPFRLAVVGTTNYRLDGIEVDARAWRPDTEISDLHEFDIGIMPVPDDDWSKGKCGLKLIQYMAVGIPVVGSPVGVNREIIAEGSNGFLAASEDAWVDRLARLIDDAALRARMGAAGRATVEQHYSAQVWAPRVAGIFETIVCGHRSGTARVPALA